MRKEILEHFKNNDKKLYEAALKFQDLQSIEPSKPEEYFIALTRHIVYQQLSGKAGAAIWTRVITLMGKNHNPENILKVSHEELRGTGLSNSKVLYIKNIADAFVSGLVKPQKLKDMDEEKVIETLTQIKGIGRWTAEMFLMFTLGREDVFSLGDLGLKKGFRKVYGMKNDPSPKYITRMTKKWSSYRSYGSLLMWASLDNK